MTSPGYRSILLALLVAASVAAAQARATQPQRQPVNTAPFVVNWKWFEYQRQVTHQFPTDYRIGGIYRLRKDVVVQQGGTSSKVTPYWVDISRGVEEVKEALRDPQAAKEREIKALRDVGAENPRLAPYTEMFVRGVRNRKETRSILSEATKLRFQQIWLHRSFEMGVSVDPYAEVLDGPLRGKWVSIAFLSERRAHQNAYCYPDPEYLEYVGE